MAGFTLINIRQAFFPKQREDGNYVQRILVQFETEDYPNGTSLPLNVLVLPTDTIEQIITKCETAANDHLTALYPEE